MVDAMDRLGSADASSGAAAGSLAPVYAELTTPEQLQDWYQVFHAYDRDGGGDVSTTELGLMLRVEVGHRNQLVQPRRRHPVTQCVDNGARADAAR